MIKSKFLFLFINILLVVFLIFTGAIPISYKVFYYLIFFYLIANLLVNKSPFSKIVTYVIVFAPLLMVYGGGYLYIIINNESSFLGKPYFWGILAVLVLLVLKNKFKIKAIYSLFMVCFLSAFIAGSEYYLLNINYEPEIEQKKADEVLLFNESGTEFNLSSFKGKLTLIEFWTTSCAYCPESLQEFHELAKQYNTNTKIDFITVNINLGKRQDTIYKKELESTIHLPKLNTDEIIFKQLSFNAAPAVLVLDQNSNIVYLGVPNFRKYSKNYLPEIVKNELNKM